MSALPAVLTIAGTVLSAVGKVRQGNEVNAAAQFNSAVSLQKAQTIKESAAFTSETLKKRTELEQFQIEQDKKSTLSTQRAGFAKSGVRLFEGSPLEVMAGTAAEFEADLSASRYNEAVSQEELRFESETGISRATSEAEAFRLKGKAAKKSSFISAGGTILRGVSSLGLLDPK